MKLDVRRMFETGAEPAEGEFQADFSGEDFPGYTLTGPVNVRYAAAREGDRLLVQLWETASVSAQCARCLDELHQEFPVERTYEIRKGDWEDEEAELPFDVHGRLDLRELAFEEILLEVPTVLLCSEDCLGLCPECGQRRPCGCAPKQSAPDPRLSILSTLLSE